MAEIFNEDTLKEVRNITVEGMKNAEKALIDRAQAMDNAENYMDLTDFCYDKVLTYVENLEDLKQILTNPKFTSTIFNTIAEMEEFKEFEAEEVHHFPRIILMTIVTGSEKIACQAAAEVYKDSAEAVGQFKNLENVYAGYLQDALAYGRGEKKNVAFTGKVE